VGGDAGACDIEEDEPVARPLPARPLGAGFILSLVVIVAACSSSGATTAPSAAPPTQAPASASAAPSTGGGGTAGSAVSIKDFSFVPGDLTAKVGQEITWTNNGQVAHAVSFNTGLLDSGSLSAGATFTHTFDAPGTFTYHCNFHSSMEATITITQ
jgi:plastocyanin